MAKVKKKSGSIPSNTQRVSPLKPGLRGARNWASAQVRAASHTQQGFLRLVASIVAIIIFTIFMGIWLGGYMPNVKKATGDFTQDRMMSLGFVVKRVDVMGEGRLQEADVRTALGIYAGDYLFGADIDGAQKRVESLAWVDRAVIRRLWPDRIVVQIFERQPYALWQHEGLLQVVDASGDVISDADPARFSHLSVFVGEDARFAVSEMMQMMTVSEELSKRDPNFIQVGPERWDIVLNQGKMRVKLPDANPSRAIAQLAGIHAQTRILDRHIAVIDMRLVDRITLTPANETPA